MFKRGDLVVCIDNSNFENLTISNGCKYIVDIYISRTKTGLEYMSLLNVSGIYSPDRFVSLKEYRKRKVLRCLRQEI